MKPLNLIISLVLGIVILIIVLQCVYIVKETEQVVITQFGKPVGEPVTTPGIKLKAPFVQLVNRFEKRFMEWDGDPNQIPTKDKKFIFVDTYARWRITDPLQFFKRLTNERGAMSRIDDILDGETRNIIANHNIEETVRSENRTPLTSGELSEVLEDSLMVISVGREKIQRMILVAANEKAKDLGIEILDLRIKRINYVPEVQTQVFERMKSERFRIAERFRSEGQGEASRINGEKERELKNIQSLAFKTSEEIKGRADGKAASIYAGAYDRNPQSRSFYAFLKSMETFEKTFDGQTSVILSTDSELYRYLKRME